jgi:OOP family OmpA-OmpF porin
VSLPTSGGQNFLGSDYWTLYPSLVAAGDLGPVRIAGELGFRMRQRRQIGDFIQDDEVQLAAGATWTIIPELQAILEGQYRIGLGGPINAGRAPNSAETPLELDAGVRIVPLDALSIDVGVGTGVIGGYGAPLVRGFLTARYRIDAGGCALGPEDDDGFQDGDFCLDPDNDGDGVEDVADRCANDAEDADGFQDDDGCPEGDNDGDGVPDETDTCPTAVRGRRRVRSPRTAAPSRTTTRTGSTTALDALPDGSRGRKTTSRTRTAAPSPARGARPRHGLGHAHPHRRDHLLRVRHGRPAPGLSCRSSTSSPHVIRARSIRSLRIRIDGHTDDTRRRRDLQRRPVVPARARRRRVPGRAAACARARLEYHGYGAAQPQAPNDDPASRALNRRVEFTILHADPPPASRPTGAGRRPSTAE